MPVALAILQLLLPLLPTALPDTLKLFQDVLGLFVGQKDLTPEILAQCRSLQIGTATLGGILDRMADQAEAQAAANLLNAANSMPKQTLPSLP